MLDSLKKTLEISLKFFLYKLSSKNGPLETVENMTGLKILFSFKPMEMIFKLQLKLLTVQ